MQIRDRVKELRRVPASTLRPSPRNWRTHPKGQQQALRGVLAEIGYADALIARELPDGSLELIDGHLRAETTPDLTVPVLILDVTELEASKLLATLDPMAAMVTADPEKLKQLLADAKFESEAVAAMLVDLAVDTGIQINDLPPDADDVPAPPDAATTLAGDLWILGSHRAGGIGCLLCYSYEDPVEVKRGSDPIRLSEHGREPCPSGVHPRRVEAPGAEASRTADSLN